MVCTEQMARPLLNPLPPSLLVQARHARIEFINGEFQLMDQSQEHHAAIRVGTGRAAPEWPLSVSAAFSAGNSIFVVEAVEAVDSAEPLLTLSVRTGGDPLSPLPLTTEPLLLTVQGPNTERRSSSHGEARPWAARTRTRWAGSPILPPSGSRACCVLIRQTTRRRSVFKTANSPGDTLAFTSIRISPPF